MILAAALLGYLLGSIPFSLIVGRLAAGTDVRQHGSGNLGATNVMRVAGRKAGVVALLLDILKGLAAVMAIRLAGGSPAETSVAAVAAVLGHSFPAFAGFRGGKGVATGLGACFALAPAAVGIALACFVATLLVWRMVSLGSMVAFAALPPAAWALGAPPPVVAAGTFLALLVIWRHRANIRRIARGAEPRIGSRGKQ